MPAPIHYLCCGLEAIRQFAVRPTASVRAGMRHPLAILSPVAVATRASASQPQRQPALIPLACTGGQGTSA